MGIEDLTSSSRPAMPFQSAASNADLRPAHWFERRRVNLDDQSSFEGRWLGMMPTLPFMVVATPVLDRIPAARGTDAGYWALPAFVASGTSTSLPVSTL